MRGAPQVYQPPTRTAVHPKDISSPVLPPRRTIPTSVSATHAPRVAGHGEGMSVLTRIRRAVAVAIALLVLTTPSAVATWSPDTSADASAADAEHSWTWPVLGRVVEAYRQPAHEYAAGHRGIDIDAGTDTVVAPDDGVILFAGVVVDRPVVTIDHGEGLVSTLEPVTTSLPTGTRVAAGDVVGTLADGGHAARGALHLGARLDGVYINPLLLLGGVPGAVLLPCC